MCVFDILQKQKVITKLEIKLLKSSILTFNVILQGNKKFEKLPKLEILKRFICTGAV